jgi:hypothetical protein
MSVYEIRLHRPDGTLSVVMKVMATGDADAKTQALIMLAGGISNAHIWHDDDFIGSIYASPPNMRFIERSSDQVRAPTSPPTANLR